MTPPLSPTRYLPAGLCALAGAAIFQFWGNATHGYIVSNSLFYWWGFQWVNPASETQHGFLILGISAFLLHRNLKGAGNAASSREAFLPAACAMALGLGLHVLGFTAEQARLSIAGLLVFMWGVLAFAGGSRWARASAFPLLFLVFAIPLNALDSAGFWLRMWVVGTSGAFLHALGIHVLVNGTQLLSPDGTYDYDVAAACSGVRSLVALSALSLLVGYLRFNRKALWVVMFAACFPLVYLGNVVRIVSIVGAAQRGGQAWGDRVHEAMGFVVFAIVLGGVLGIAEVLSRWRPAWVVQAPGGPVVTPREYSTPSGRGPWPAAIAVVVASAVAIGLLVRAAGMPATGGSGIVLAEDGVNPVSLPTFLGDDWIGRRSEVTQIERQVLPPDTGYSRKVYVSLSDPTKQVFLSVVLSGRDRTSIHRPELCLVGQGWTIRSSFAHQFAYPGAPEGFPATVLRVEKELITPRGRVEEPQLFAYYFVGSQATVATHWQRLGRDSWDRIAHGRSDRWAYVVVQTGSSDGEQAALARLQTILDGTLPAFQKHA